MLVTDTAARSHQCSLLPPVAISANWSVYGIGLIRLATQFRMIVTERSARATYYISDSLQRITKHFSIPDTDTP